MPKRRRTVGGFSTKRPIDKKITVVLHDAVPNSQVNTTIFTATSACTMVGLRWRFNFTTDVNTAIAARIRWVIVLLEDGDTLDTIGTANAADFYTPEQNCLAWGVSVVRHTVNVSDWFSEVDGSTKTMRKMRTGDAIVAVFKGDNTQTTDVLGGVQLFCKE